MTFQHHARRTEIEIIAHRERPLIVILLPIRQPGAAGKAARVDLHKHIRKYGSITV